MSIHCPPVVSWVALLLYLSSVTQQVSGVWPPASSPRQRGLNASDLPHSQVAPNPVRNRGANNQKAANEKVISKREVTKTEASKKVTSKIASSGIAAGDVDAGTLCAYRVLEDGDEGRLCFRHTQLDFACPSNTCRQVRSPGGHLVANMLSNGSVLLQWTCDGHDRSDIPGVPSEAPAPSAAPPTGSDWKTLPALPMTPSRGQREQQGGFRMSCWWNGSYTQFECATVVLGRSCRDFLLTELHENVPYRICLQPLEAVWDGAGTEGLHTRKKKTTVEIWDRPGCVDFSVSPSGMQDIVIAMTTVGGAICVMLVIICLLVAYITENIMSPSGEKTHNLRVSLNEYSLHPKHESQSGKCV